MKGDFGRKSENRPFLVEIRGLLDHILNQKRHPIREAIHGCKRLILKVVRKRGFELLRCCYRKPPELVRVRSRHESADAGGLAV